MQLPHVGLLVNQASQGPAWLVASQAATKAETSAIEHALCWVTPV